MWGTLVKSAPDFLFSITETRACYLPVGFGAAAPATDLLAVPAAQEPMCIVASRFNWFGTRVLDIKIAEKMNEEVLVR